MPPPKRPGAGSPPEDGAGSAAAPGPGAGPPGAREPGDPPPEELAPGRPPEELAPGSPPGRHAAGASQLRRSPRPPRTLEERAAARETRRRTLRRRRLVALGILAAVVVVLVVVLGARACGGAPGGAPSATGPSPTPTALRTPTAARPLRMAAYGDSVGGGALLGLKLLTAERKDIKVHRFVKVATGLARPDFFDWPAYLEEDLAKRRRPFEAVLVMLGANDGQNVVAGGKGLKFGTRSWKKMYAKRAPRVDYMDAWTAVDAPKTSYQAALRQQDGVHLSVDGGPKVAREVLDAVARDWRLPAFVD